MSTYTPSFVVAIRANGTLGARVKFWSDAAKTVPFDFTGYGAFWGSVKSALSDTAPLFALYIEVSDVAGDTGGPVAPADGWLLIYASADDTAAIQAIAESLPSGRKRGFIDIFGTDSQGNRVPIGHGFADLFASVTETFS